MSENTGLVENSENINRAFDISNLVQIIAIATPVLMLIGVAYKYGIYQSEGIDSTWMVSLFSPTDFIFASSEVIFYYGVAVLYMTKIINENTYFQEFILHAVLIFLTGILFHFLYDAPLSIYFYIFFSFIAFYCILYAHILFKIIGLIIIFSIPFHLGTQTYAGGIKNLPIVNLEIPSKSEKWYLLDRFGDKAILIKKNQGRNNFKIIELKDINYIESKPR